MILLLDFYVDEPACFGVPPFLSPYVRYTAGALVDGGISTDRIAYRTVDQIRKNGFELDADYEAVFLIAGYTVPGRYLGGKIGSIADICTFLDQWKNNKRKAAVFVGGPVKYAEPFHLDRIRERGGRIIRGDIERFAFDFAKDPKHADDAELEKKRRTYEEIDRWAVRGAFITERHPSFPYLILEMETYRGCTRDVYCSFCSEAFYGKPSFRTTAGIADEVRELYAIGNRYFRLGRQADLISYLPFMNEIKRSFPRPNPESLRRLYGSIRSAAPDLKMLHLDNINPGILATYPDESREIIKIICENNTPGDTAAMGIESVDETVITLNDLKCDEEEAYRAIEMINEYGATRKEGIPILLPGLNFIQGLAGETDRTFEKNYNFLRRIKENGLLLRRINLRQASIHPRTKLDRIREGEMSGEKLALLESLSSKHTKASVLKNRFEFYREKIREEIDRPMMDAVFPVGTKLKEVILEADNGGFFLGRPLGSYPPTIKIPTSDRTGQSAFQGHTPVTAIVTGANERSLSGLCWPIDLSTLGEKGLATLPGIGKKRAGALAALPQLCYDDIERVSEGTMKFQKTDFIESKTR